MRIKRGLSQILSVSAAVVLVSGTMSVSAFASAKKEESSVPKPASISVMMDSTLQAGIKNGAEAIMAKYKELTGITLDIRQAPSHNQYYEWVNIQFTAGTVADALIVGGNNYVKYSGYGALVDITDMYENSEVKNNIIDQAYIDKLKIDGKLYGLPQYSGNGNITYVRGDWLETLGMEIPKNYSEYIEMLKAFRDNDLDGNGKKDTIPFTGHGLLSPNDFPTHLYLTDFYQDAVPDFVIKNNVYVDGMLQPEMRFALTRLTTAFSDGLIDKEILTNNTTISRTKFQAGNVGAFTYWAGMWSYDLQTGLNKSVPDGKVVPIPAIERSKYIERPSNPIAITYSCKNPEGVFKYLLEFMLDEGEGQHLFTYGVEGVTYKMEDDVFTWLPRIAAPTNKYAKAYIERFMSITGFEDFVPVPEEITVALDLYRSNRVFYGLYPSSKAYNDYNTDLIAMRNSTITKIVYGDVSLDDGLAQYEKDSKAYVEAILKDFNKQ